MSHFEWQQTGEWFLAETRYGTAWIKQGEGIFTYGVAHPSRESIPMSGPPDVGDFEKAEYFILLNLAWLADPPLANLTYPNQWLNDDEVDHAGAKYTLDLGVAALPAGTDWTHLARIGIVRQILFGEPLRRQDGQPMSSESPTTEVLDWMPDGPAVFAMTRFGRAVIVEHQEPHNPWAIGRRRGWYTTRIEDAGGAVLASGVAHEPRRFPTFEEAEEYIGQLLTMLAEPPQIETSELGKLLATAEVHYPAIAFSLDVCANAIRPPDPILRERYNIIKGDFFLKVD